MSLDYLKENRDQQTLELFYHWEKLCWPCNGIRQYALAAWFRERYVNKDFICHNFTLFSPVSFGTILPISGNPHKKQNRWRVFWYCLQLESCLCLFLDVTNRLASLELHFLPASVWGTFSDMRSVSTLRELQMFARGLQRPSNIFGWE